MMGEEDGNPAEAYTRFRKLFKEYIDNPELASVGLAFEKITEFNEP